jgi:replicative DNA helicase
MTKGELTQIMYASISSIDLKYLDAPDTMSEDQFNTLNKAVNKFSALPIFIDECPGLTGNQLRAKVRKLANKGVKVVIIDYLQLMGADGKVNNREQEVAKVSRLIKQLGLETGIHFIALSQLSREFVQKNRKPELTDLRESGAIEQDADTVLFLWVPSDEFIKQNPEASGKVLVLGRKNRGGERTCEFPLRFEPSKQRWMDKIETFSSTTQKNGNNFNPNDWVNQ